MLRQRCQNRKLFWLFSYSVIRSIGWCEVRFLELREKDVINCKTGDKLGNVIDIEFDPNTGCILFLIVPKMNHILSCFSKNATYVIPYKRIVKLGKDTILVDIIEKDCLK
ncbi:MAG: YlmC/YmxH family sporulation protein [Anaerostipes sp.]|nr:YlmC/YmxH family sporulation protein [Anaerostipes sp.]